MDNRELLVNKLEKEKANKDNLLAKRKSIDEKIQKSDINIKKISEDIENYDTKNLVKTIKLKGYSIADIQDKLLSIQDKQ